MGGKEGRDETEGEGSMRDGKQTIGRGVVEDLHCGFSLMCCITARFIPSLLVLLYSTRHFTLKRS
jgi:hypothetical protein